MIREATSHAAVLVDVALRNLAIATEEVGAPSMGSNAHLATRLEDAACAMLQAARLPHAPTGLRSSAQLIDTGRKLLIEADASSPMAGLARLQQGVTHDQAIGMLNAAIIDAQQGWAQLGVDEQAIHDLGSANPVWNAVESVRLLGGRSSDETADIERHLSSATINAASREPIGDPSFHHGQLFSYELESGHSTASAASRVVVKTAAQQAVQERFGFQVAKLLGIDHLFPVIVLDKWGNARIQALGGTHMEKDVTGEGARAFEAARTAWHIRNNEVITPDQARAAARMERQLLGVFDYIMANADRHRGNVLLDHASGEGAFIDSGLLGSGERGIEHILSPNLYGTFQGVSATQSSSPWARVNLDPPTLEYLKRRVQPEQLITLWNQAAADAREVAVSSSSASRGLDELALRDFTSPNLGVGIGARIDHLVSNGWYELSVADTYPR